MSQGLNLATVDDNVSFEKSAWGEDFTVTDDEINRQNRSPIHPALISTYIFLRLPVELVDLPLGGRSALQPGPAYCADTVSWGVLEGSSAPRAISDPPVPALDALGPEALDA